MKAFLGRTLGALFAALICAASYISYEYFRPHVLYGELGGILDDHYKTYTEYRQNGDRVVIDGMCMSACTMVLGLIPRERLCATEHAMFGFHSATWGNQYSADGTAFIWKTYPLKLQEILGVHGWTGGPHPHFIFLNRDDLNGLVRACE